MEMERYFPSNWNGESGGRPFVPGNFHLLRVKHLNFNWLNRKF